MTLEQYAALPGTEISGIFRSFTYTESEMYYILYYLFVILWVVYMATATSQFVLAYAVQLWYFTAYEDGEKHGVPACPLIQGYKTGILYHLGSFAFGSFIIAVL